MELTVKNKRILIAYFTFSLAFINDVYAQKDCSQAPTAALRVLCEQLHRWDTNARVTLQLAIVSLLPKSSNAILNCIKI